MSKIEVNFDETSVFIPWPGLFRYPPVTIPSYQRYSPFEMKAFRSVIKSSVFLVFLSFILED
jgi:hypothetical protein